MLPNSTDIFLYNIGEKAALFDMFPPENNVIFHRLSKLSFGAFMGEYTNSGGAN